MKKKINLWFLLSAVSLAYGDVKPGAPVQPYIDSLKEKNQLEEVPKVDLSDTQSAESHISDLREEAQQVEAHPKEGQPHIDSILSSGKAAESHPSDGQPHIEATKRGRELQPKISSVVRRAAGINVNVAGRVDVTSESLQSNTFNSVYSSDSKYNPMLDVYFEYHLFHSRIYGSFGPLFRIGVITAKGKGRFTKKDLASDVGFSFFAIPVSAGASYRFNLLRYLEPFIQVAAMAIPMNESRSDDKVSRKALTYGYSYNVGLGLNLDWIGSKDAWQRYDQYGIVHTYLVVQHYQQNPLVGKVKFKTASTMVGLNFEF